MRAFALEVQLAWVYEDKGRGHTSGSFASAFNHSPSSVRQAFAREDGSAHSVVCCGYCWDCINVEHILKNKMKTNPTLDVKHVHTIIDDGAAGACEIAREARRPDMRRAGKKRGCEGEYV